MCVWRWIFLLDWLLGCSLGSRCSVQVLATLLLFLGVSAQKNSLGHLGNAFLRNSSNFSPLTLLWCILHSSLRLCQLKGFIVLGETKLDCAGWNCMHPMFQWQQPNSVPFCCFPKYPLVRLQCCWRHSTPSVCTEHLSLWALSLLNADMSLCHF